MGPGLISPRIRREGDRFLGHVIGAAHIVPAEGCWAQSLLHALPYVHHARGAGPKQPFVRVCREEIHMLHGSWKRAEGLYGIYAKRNLARLQFAPDAVEIYSVPSQEMAGGQRYQPGLLVHLPNHIRGPNPAQFA